jgi:Holliday junction resolvase
MSAKKKGNKNEYRTIRLLAASGYVSTRAAGSLGVFDVVGIGSSDIALVSVKSNRWPSQEEIEAIQMFRCPPTCKKLIHRWRDRQRLPDVKEV